MLQKHSLRLPFTLILLLTMTGCSLKPYTVTFNDNVISSPNAALLNSIVSDPSLQACLNQNLSNLGTTDATRIKLLACPGAGIKSLDGINALASLEQLELSDNSIDNLSPLSSLRNLRVLGLRNNGIRNIGPLTSLPLLRFVSLQDNDNILCRQLDELGAKLGNTLNRPLGCVK